MQKEKQVKSYQRRTKSGKVVSVKAHTAKYTAAEEKAKESARSKKGSGEELEKLKGAKALSEKDLGFSMEEFAEWYNGTGSEVDKRVEKVLKKHLGKDGYKELNNYAADNYKRGGHKSMFKNLGDHFDRLKPKTTGSKETKVQKDTSLGLPKVGEKVKLANWMDHSQKKSSFEVIGVQKATKADKEADISNWLWVKDSKGKVYAATQTADGKIGVDTTWTNFTDKKKHPYEKSLKDAGYSLSKDKGYWEVSSKDAKSKPSKSTSKVTEKPAIPEASKPIGGKKLTKASVAKIMKKDNPSSEELEALHSHFKKQYEGKYFYYNGDNYKYLSYSPNRKAVRLTPVTFNVADRASRSTILVTPDKLSKMPVTNNQTTFPKDHVKVVDKVMDDRFGTIFGKNGKAVRNMLKKL